MSKYLNFITIFLTIIFISINVAHSNNIFRYPAPGIGGPTPDTITIRTTSLPTAESNTSYSHNMQYSYNTGNATWSWSENGNGIPSGMSFNTSSGLISGTPTTAGTYPLTFTVTDDINSDSIDLDFTVSGAVGKFFSVGTSLFGYDVAIGSSSMTIGVSSTLIDTYVYDFSLNELHELVALDATSSDNFGISVGNSGNLSIVGAHRHTASTDSGAAYIFSNTTGGQLVKLLPNDPESGMYYGRAVAIDGNIAVVGAHRDHASNFGAVYLHNATTGAQTYKLEADDGSSNWNLGVDVAISGNTVIAGANGVNTNGSNSGAAYVFNASNGSQVFKLMPSDATASQQFGISVDVWGNYAVVGAIGDSTNGSSSGAAYIFNMTTGAQVAKLLPPDGASGDNFGRSVAISDDYVIVNNWKEKLYIYDTSGNYIKTISSPEPGTNFAYTLDLYNKSFVVGAVGDTEGGSSNGAAYLFIE